MREKLGMSERLGDEHALESFCVVANCNMNRDRDLLTVFGRTSIDFPLVFIGADLQVGPNYTGQPAVDSYYRSRGGNK